MPRVFCFVLLWMGSVVSGMAEYRTYTSKDGRKVEAEAITVQGDTLKFRTATGQVHEVPVSSLSEADQRYLEDWKLKFPGAVLPDLRLEAQLFKGDPTEKGMFLGYRFSLENREAVPRENVVLKYQIHFTEASGRPIRSGRVVIESIAPNAIGRAASSQIEVSSSASEVAGLFLRVEKDTKVLAQTRLEVRPGSLEKFGWRKREAEATVRLADLGKEEDPRPRIHGRDLRLDCTFRVPVPVADGAILTQGGSNNGYCLYLKDRELHFAVRFGRAVPSRVTVALPKDLGFDTPVTATAYLEDGAIGIQIQGADEVKAPVARQIEETPILGLVVGPDEYGRFSNHCPPIRFDGKVEALWLDVWEGEAGQGPPSAPGPLPAYRVELAEILSKPPSPKIMGVDFSVQSTLNDVERDGEGVILTQGGNQYGHSLYLRSGKLWYAVRSSPDSEPTRVSVPLPLLSNNLMVKAGLERGEVHLAIGEDPPVRAKLREPIAGNPAAVFTLGPNREFPFSKHSPTAAFDGTVRALRFEIWEPKK